MKRLSYVERIAEDLVSGNVTVWDIFIGDGMFLNLDDEGCELCGGTFPPIGAARMFYLPFGECGFIHPGCHREVENWLPTHSNFGVGLVCNCGDGCSRCSGTGVVAHRNRQVEDWA